MLTNVAQFVLIAAGLEWLKFVFVIVFFLVWIFNNLLSDKAKAKGKPLQRPQVPPPRPDAGEAGAGGGQPQLAGEIEEFLKRANQKRQEKVRRKQPAKAAAKPAPPTPPKPARRLVQESSQGQDFEVSTGKSVAEHVQKHLDTRGFTERAEHLMDEDIRKADAEREAHRKQVFEHKVGRLADTSTAEAAPAGPTAATTATIDAAAAMPLAALLANPQGLKQAIVLNEVLSRPEHRW